jgi:hypothetical protein
MFSDKEQPHPNHLLLYWHNTDNPWGVIGHPSERMLVIIIFLIAASNLFTTSGPCFSIGEWHSMKCPAISVQHPPIPVNRHWLSDNRTNSALAFTDDLNNFISIQLKISFFQV